MPVTIAADETKFPAATAADEAGTESADCVATAASSSENNLNRDPRRRRSGAPIPGARATAYSYD